MLSLTGRFGERAGEMRRVWSTFASPTHKSSRGPSCCRKRSGEYDFEPVYEELNDLRKRDSLANGEYKMRYAEKRSENYRIHSTEFTEYI